jgi:hypothetical protein
MACGDSAPDIAAADDDRDLHAHLVDFLDLLCNPENDLGRDAVLAPAFAEGFTADFEDDSPEFRLRFGGANGALFRGGHRAQSEYERLSAWEGKFTTTKEPGWLPGSSQN